MIEFSLNKATATLLSARQPQLDAFTFLCCHFNQTYYFSKIGAVRELQQAVNISAMLRIDNRSNGPMNADTDIHLLLEFIYLLRFYLGIINSTFGTSL